MTHYKSDNRVRGNRYDGKYVKGPHREAERKEEAYQMDARRRRRTRGGRPGPLAYGCVVGRSVVAKTQGELTPHGVNGVTENKRLNRES